MIFYTILGLAFGLAMDAFAVAVAAGFSLPEIRARHVFRLAFHFGWFQFMMPVLGWYAGHTLVHWIAAYEHWIAFALLALIGGKMLWDSFDREHAAQRGDPTRGWLLVTLSVATSLDALAVGLSLALLGVSIWKPSAVIGLVASAMTALGMIFGSRLGSHFGRLAERLGGLVLIGIGLQIALGG